MRIGLIDVDGHNYPNIPLMKISAWHKEQGDFVEWYEPLFHSMGEPFDIVYMSKVFSFTPDYQYHVNCKKLVRGGLGTQSVLLMAKRFMINLRILTYQMRLNTYIQIIHCIQN